MDNIDEQAKMMRAINRIEENEGKRNRKNNINDSFVCIGGEKFNVDQRLFLEERLSMRILDCFNEMTEEDKNLKYKSIDRPKHIYTNEYKTVEIMFDLDETETKNEHISELNSEMLKVMQKAYVGSKFIEKEDLKVDGVNISLFSLGIQLMDDKICKLTFFMPVHNKTLVGGFSCKLTEYKDWKDLIYGMINSIRIVKTS